MSLNFPVKENAKLLNFKWDKENLKVPFSLDATKLTNEQLSLVLDLIENKLGGIYFWNKNSFLKELNYFIEEGVDNLDSKKIVWLKIFVNKENKLRISFTRSLEDTGITVYSLEQLLELIENLREYPLNLEG